MNFGWEFNHLGMMVLDKEKILSHYQTIGVGVSVGPQPLMPYIEGEGEITFFKELEGNPISYKYKTGGAHNFNDGQSQIGNCQLEVYPMHPGPGMFISRYLEKKGDGINHIAFNSKNIEKDTKYFLDLGCELVFNVTINGKTVENYIDTRLHGDLMISLRPPADEWEKSWRRNNESHPLVNKWKFLGLGVCVKDINAASNYYSHLGFEKLSEVEDVKDWKISSQRFFQSGVIFELIEAEEKSIYSDSLEKRGDGVAEITFAVNDLMREIDLLGKKNVETLHISKDNKMASIASGNVGNILIKLIQNN